MNRMIFLKFKIQMFLFNIIVSCFIWGTFSRFSFEIFIASGFGLIGWMLFSMNIFFNHWGKDVKEFLELKEHNKKYSMKEFDKNVNTKGLKGGVVSLHER